MRRHPLGAARDYKANILAAARDEISASGANIGYRRSNKVSNSEGCICRRNDIRQIVKQLDPNEANMRKQRRLHGR